MCIIRIEKYERVSLRSLNAPLVRVPTVQGVRAVFARFIPPGRFPQMCGVRVHRIQLLFFVFIGWHILSSNNDFSITQKLI